MGYVWLLELVASVVARFKLLSLAEKAGLLTGAISLTDTIITKLVGHDLKEEAFKAIVGEVLEKTGLQLNEREPFSDASLAGALSQRMGISIRSVKDRDMIVEDIEDFAVGRVSEKLGFSITTLRDPVRMRQDFEAAALAMIAEKTGIPLVASVDGGPASVEDIKSQVEDWARARIMVKVSGDANAALEMLGGAGVDFESVAADMNGKLEALGSAERVTAKGLALKVAESLVSASVQRLNVVAMGGSKKSRRTLQIREAQRRFRAAHGNRQKYIPLGMDFVLPEPDGNP